MNTRNADLLSTIARDREEPAPPELPQREVGCGIDTSPKPVLFYAVTFQCVRTCRFCFNNAAKAANGTFSRIAYSALLQEMATYRKTSRIPLRLNLTGGEPLLEPQIGDLALMARDIGIPISLTTAGIPIPSERMRRLAEAGTEVTFSFDCCDPALYERTRGKGTFRLAMQSLTTLVDSGCLKRAIIVLTQETAPWMERTVAFLARFGVQDFILMEQTLPSETFEKVGLRIDRSRVSACQELEPRSRYVLGHQCPVTLNVSPDGRYFIQAPPQEIEILGSVFHVGLMTAYGSLARTAERCAVEPSEIFEPPSLPDRDKPLEVI